MRIIAGTARGHHLKGPPAGAATRPTTDKVRGAIFNVIGTSVQGARVLDLFAGTGALGIEALSRGAAHATFVESDRGLAAVIRANLDAARLGDRAEVMVRDVRRVGGALQRARPFDLVLLDPPYGVQLEREAVQMLLDHALLARDAWVIVEHATRETIDLAGPRLELHRSKGYGDTTVACYLARTAPLPPEESRS